MQERRPFAVQTTPVDRPSYDKYWRYLQSFAAAFLPPKERRYCRRGMAGMKPLFRETEALASARTLSEGRMQLHYQLHQFWSSQWSLRLMLLLARFFIYGEAGTFFVFCNSFSFFRSWNFLLGIFGFALNRKDADFWDQLQNQLKTAAPLAEQGQCFFSSVRSNRRIHRSLVLISISQ